MQPIFVQHEHLEHNGQRHRHATMTAAVKYIRLLVTLGATVLQDAMI